MQLSSQYFQAITGIANRSAISLTMSTPCSIGAMVARDATTPETVGALASGDFDGFATQQVTAAGPTWEDRYRGVESEPWPIVAGTKLSLIKPNDGDEFELEGGENAGSTGFEARWEGQDNLVTTAGTGAISNVTAKDTELSVFSGAIRVAQSGDRVKFVVVDSGLTPATTSNVRVLVKAVFGANLTA